MDPAVPAMTSELLKQDLTFVYGLFQAAELEARTTERYLLVTLGGMYSYLATKDVPASLARLAWYSPVLVTLFAAIRAVGLLSRQMQALGYLRQLDQQFRFPGVKLWWEYSHSSLPLLATTAAAFYVIVFAVTCLVARRMTKSVSDA